MGQVWRRKEVIRSMALSCSACHASTPKWRGECWHCGAWNTIGVGPAKATKEPKKRKPIKQVSAKRAAENIEREKIRPEVLKRGCEVCPVIRAHLGKLPWKCPGRASDMHEVQTRARRGSITDPKNILATCRRGHMWVTENSGKGGPAEKLGLVLPSWAKKT